MRIALGSLAIESDVLVTKIEGEISNEIRVHCNRGQSASKTTRENQSTVAK